MLAGFCGYWNIKGRGHMVREFNHKCRELSAMCSGAFSAIAPQVRHTKKMENQA